jgi:hypothetical protein
VADDFKINDSKIKKSIIHSKRVKIWFWDTVREYTGEAVSMTATDLTALLKLGGTGMATVIPSQAVMDGLIKHLSRRVVEFKVSGQSLEVSLKGTINEVQKDFENPRRLLLVAKFQTTSERNQTILNRLGQNLAT